MRLLFLFLSIFILDASVIAQSDKKLTDSMAGAYKKNYLDTLNDTLLFTQKNLRFIATFPQLINSKDRIFKFYYDHAETADEVIGGRKGYAMGLVKYIIRKEEIDTFLYKDAKVIEFKPHWKKMYRNIKKKYSKELANEIVPDSRFSYDRRIGNWKEFGDLFEEKIKEKRPTRTSNLLGGNYGDSWTLNSTAWDVFLSCNDKAVLKKALSWVSLGITLCETEASTVQYLDTKANILYKLGDDSVAIQYEEKVLALDKRTKEYQVTLNKMRQGQPTWPTQ